MSVRGLQSAFQRVHQTSPLGYLRAVRLLMARQQLGSGAAASVSDVALSVGIVHLAGSPARTAKHSGNSPARLCAPRTTHPADRTPIGDGGSRAKRLRQESVMPHATTQTARTPSRWQAPQRAEGRLCTRAGLPGCMIRPN